MQVIHMVWDKVQNFWNEVNNELRLDIESTSSDRLFTQLANVYGESRSEIHMDFCHRVQTQTETLTAHAVTLVELMVKFY